MKIALGIHVKHDRCACIIKDGTVVVNIANERIDRVKYSASHEIPYEAIDAALKYCGLHINQVSCIGISGAGIESEKVKEFYKDELFSHYNCREIPFYFVSHHLAHAYSTYYSSQFDNSLIFVADGGGDYYESKQEAETLYYGKTGKIQLLSSRMQDMVIRKMDNPINSLYPFMTESVKNHQISLARKYDQINHLLGFKYGECGKTMGLASYGESFWDFSNVTYQNLDFRLSYKDILEEIYSLQIISGKTHKEYIRLKRQDIAATIQRFTETALISLLKNFRKNYGCQNLCLAGGIFLNCLANQKIICECNYDNVFIIPAAGDDGQALGSAYYAYLEYFGYKNKISIHLPYIGLDYNENEIEDLLTRNNILFNKYSDNDLATVIAKYIAENKIVGFHRGKTEFGPRALCHRSILANPANPAMKDILNSRVKHREEFRPFAPSILSEYQYEFFELCSESEYMLLAPVVKENYRQHIPSVTHVDNTSRVQAISRESEPFVHSLLCELKKIIGVPVVLNTSFNVAGQPIVESPMDALSTFLNTNIDILVIGNYVINKNDLEN